MKSMLKNNKAITLIALVITIVILIILAGVAISLTLGENGLITRTKVAKQKYQYSSAKEILDIKLADIQAECLGNGEDYTIKKIAGKFKLDSEILLEKYYPEDTAKVKGTAGNEPAGLKGIVVSVEQYNQFKFLIGETGKIAGILMEDITDDIESEDFIDIHEFEQNDSYLQAGKTNVKSGVSLSCVTNSIDGDNISITITVRGNVKKVKLPNGEIVNSDGSGTLIIDYTITKEQEYTFEVEMEDGTIINKKVTDPTNYIKQIVLEKEQIFLGYTNTQTMTIKELVPTYEGKSLYNNTVTWTSSDTSIATIDATTGTITAKSKTGTTTITATANDGGGATATCEVSVENAYYIYNKQQLINMEQGDRTATYYLMDNIDLSGDEWTSITGNFNGKLEGNGHTISGLTGQPLFNVLKDATIKNLKFENVNIYDGKDANFVGCVAGKSGNYSATFENCCIVSGTVAARCGGGFMGSGHDCTFKNCYSMINIINPSDQAGNPGGFMRRI